MGLGEGEGGGQPSPQNIEALVQKVLSDREDQKEQAKKIDNIGKDVSFLKNIICDEKGCRLATREELANLGQKGKKLEEYHSQELWNEIKERPKAISDLEGIMLKKLKENKDLMRKAAEDETFREKFLDSVCTTKGCRQLLNKQIDEARKKYPEEKQSWMIKKK